MAAQKEKKYCPRCKITKAIDEFSKNKASYDGYQGWCKKCKSEHHASPQGQATRLKSEAKYRNSPRRKATQKAASTRYYATAKGKAKIRVYGAIYRTTAQGVDSRRRSAKKYRASSKGKMNRAVNQAKRIARKRGAAICDFTAAQWKALQEQFKHRCAYCGKRAKGRLTQDHITPLSKGGNHTLGNIVPACRACNEKKHCSAPPVVVQPLLITA